MIESFLIPVIAGAIFSVAKGKKMDDRKKIEKVFEKCLQKDGQETVKFIRQCKHETYTEFVYRLPFYLSFSQIEQKQEHFENALNKRIEFFFDGMLRVKVFENELPEMFELTNEIINRCKGWTIPTGIDQQGNVHFHDFDRIMHMIVAGTTQYGKTVFLKMLITVLAANHPKHVRFTLIDLKGGLAFQRFADLQQVVSVASDAEEALIALQHIKADIEKRLTDFKAAGFENIRDSKIKERHFIIVDEAAELSPNSHKGKEKTLRQECENIMSYIARVAGGVGYRLIYATQYPTSDVLPRQIKQNCDSKVCFRLQTAKASEVVLNESGAEKLPFIKGRCIYLTDKPVILQAPYISNEFINDILKPYKIEKAVNPVEHHSNEPAAQNGYIIEFK
jgi:DNA segregation ATPase FtsK/SpoIIIE, S-DNA-T family